MRTDFALDYDVVTVERPQKLYLMARFVAGEAPGDRTRRPLNLSLVIDRSGSMAGDKIDYTRQAAQFLVQHLGNRDTFSIVLYNDKVETLLQPEVITNKDDIIQLLDKVRVRGTTNLSGGWLEGCKLVLSKHDDKALNRVILMSDGLANRGVTDSPTLVSMAKQKRDEGVSTTTMGMGNDFNEDLMMEMASAGGGAFYFIESPEVTPTIFQEELSGLLRVVGQNLQIAVKPTADVTSVRQLNAYPVAKDSVYSTYKLGDIFGNEIKTLVLEFTIPAMANIGEKKIATLSFAYDEIHGENTEHQTREVDVMVNVKPSGAPLPTANSEVAHSVLLLKAAQARQNAVKAADSGDYNQASSILRNVADEIEESGIQDKDLNEEKDALIKQADHLESGATGYDEYSRKTMSTQAFYTMTSRHDDTVMLRRRERKREGGEDITQDDSDGQYDSGKSNEEHPIDIIRSTLESIPAVRDGSSHVEPKPGVPPTHLTWRGQTFALEKTITRMGRSSHNEIIINERGVSRFHVQIRKIDGKILLEDLGSTNGTTIDGKLIRGAYELSVGDVVFICDAKVVFHLEGDI